VGLDRPGDEGHPAAWDGRAWLELGKTIDRRKERIAAAVWRAIKRSAADRPTLQLRVHAVAGTDEAGMIEYVLPDEAAEELK
jgi:hypothetical protein